MAHGKDTDILLERILNIKDGKLVLECLDITSIPALPSNLTELHCSETKITSLPDLPSSLTYLDCSYTQITFLPDLPSGLTHLDCQDTPITSLPDLPFGLTKLDCSVTQLTSLPTLPSGPLFLICYRTKITFSNWGYYPYSKKTTSLPPELWLWCDDSQFMELLLPPPKLKSISIFPLKSDSDIKAITLNKEEKETYESYHKRIGTLRSKMRKDPECEYNLAGLQRVLKMETDEAERKLQEEIAQKKQKAKDEEARKQKAKDDKREQAIQEQMSNITREMSLIIERAEIKSIREEAERRMNTTTSAERERLILHEMEKISIREEAERRHKLTKPSKLAAILASL